MLASLVCVSSGESTQESRSLCRKPIVSAQLFRIGGRVGTRLARLEVPEMATLAWLDGGGDKLDAMLTEARWLLEQHEAAKEVERSRLARLEEQWDRVQKERARWESSGLVELCKKRKELEMQLEFLYMHRALEQLRASRSPEEISALVMKVVKHLPAQLPKQSPFSQRLRQVVQEQRQRLLDSFHAKFEAHLEQPSAQQSVHVWSAFLESGKGWLLSFALVTLLPLRLGESTQRALEMLQRDVLEEALVPQVFLAESVTPHVQSVQTAATLMIMSQLDVRRH